jgi:muramoyltetrapeptide carboxypeptidase
MLLCGTKYWPDLKGAVLFLEEDESESPATIDRNLTRLGHLGAFDHISGLVVGRFPSSVGFDNDDGISSIIERVTKGRPLPMVTGVDLFHRCTCLPSLSECGPSWMQMKSIKSS